MNEEFKHSLSGLLYNMYFGTEDTDSIEHSKKGQTWKKHKYIRKENGKYVYPKGTSGLNTKRQNAHKYAWKTEYNNERTKYGAELVADMGDFGKLYIHTTEDGTVVISHPPYAKYTMPKGTDVQAVKSRLKNYKNKIDVSGYDTKMNLVSKMPGEGLEIDLSDIIGGKSDQTARDMMNPNWKITNKDITDIRNDYSSHLKTMDEKINDEDYRNDRIERYGYQKEDKEHLKDDLKYLKDDVKDVLKDVTKTPESIRNISGMMESASKAYDDFRKRPKKK